MPIVVTYDISTDVQPDYNRLQSMFERFGWQNLGGSAYRYPKLGSEQPTEDWFNHVIPALMLFRTHIISIQANGGNLKKFTIDVQSSTGFNPMTNYGTPPEAADQVVLYTPSKPHFGAANLKDWLDGVTWPY